jgi:hypothetical protein
MASFMTSQSPRQSDAQASGDGISKIEADLLKEFVQALFKKLG